MVNDDSRLDIAGIERIGQSMHRVFPEETLCKLRHHNLPFRSLGSEV